VLHEDAVAAAVQVAIPVLHAEHVPEEAK